MNRGRECGRGKRFAWTALASASFCNGCARSPLLDVGGSLLPSWMLCLLAGALAGFAAQSAVQQKGWQRKVAPAVLFYPGVVITVACLLWLLLFV